MKKYILFMMSVWFIQLAIFAQSRIIEVFPEQGKDIENIALALKKAADCKGRPVTVKLSVRPCEIITSVILYIKYDF